MQDIILDLKHNRLRVTKLQHNRMNHLRCSIDNKNRPPRSQTHSNISLRQAVGLISLIACYAGEFFSSALFFALYDCISNARQKRCEDNRNNDSNQ